MNKEELRKAAEQLIEAERLCRIAYTEAGQSGYKRVEENYNTVKRLTEYAKEIQRNIPELSAKHYWWEIPFSPEKQEIEDFCFEDGEYCEYAPVRIKEDVDGKVIYQKSRNMDYDSLSLELTLGTYIPLFINKKQLRNNLNKKMECRYIYDTEFIRREERAVPDLTRRKQSSADVWNQYRDAEKLKRAEYEEYLRDHEKEWDEREKFRHLSLFTNEERWLMGEMDTQDYLREDLWRDYAALDKKSKMNEDLNWMRVQATRASQEMRERQMEQRRNALRMTNAKNIIRMIPVGHIVYCNNEIMAIFLHKEEESVFEYECASDVSLSTLEGKCFESWILSEEKPALFPVIRYLASEYKDVLPDFNVLSVRPPNCPEDIWREWMAARWEEKVNE